MKFQDDISNMNTYIHTDKPKPICPPLFQSWGHKDSTARFTQRCRTPWERQDLIIGEREVLLAMYDSRH